MPNITQNLFRTWWTESLQSDWLVTLVVNSIYHSVENRVLKTIDSGLNLCISSFRHLEMF